MLPGVYGFHWSPGHLIFLGVFYAVVGSILATVVLAIRRSVRDFRGEKLEAIRWQSDFHELTPADRICRHQLNGDITHRTCDLGFDCRKCATHTRLLEKFPVCESAADEDNVFGFHVPLDRMYHRGHTWLRNESDGTVTIGLDALGERLLGKADRLRLPEPGARIEVNGTAWRAERRGVEARVLSPVDGEVIATGGPDEDFYLRVRPSRWPVNTTHLLRDAEVRPWLTRELERLQILLPAGQLGATLADGGVPVDDLAAAYPEADWDRVCGEMFLEP